jgi:hypothetical protein
VAGLIRALQHGLLNYCYEMQLLNSTAAGAAAAAVVLLLLALREWRASLGPDTPSDRLPANAAERGALKQLLQGMRRCQGEDGLPLEVCRRASVCCDCVI